MKEIFEKIQSLISQDEYGYDGWGLRMIPDDYNIGDEIPNSKVWAGDDILKPTDEDADGATALDADIKWDRFKIAYKEFDKMYATQGRVYIICGMRISSGDWCHHWWETMIAEPIICGII